MQNQSLKFHSDAVDEDTLIVQSLEGEELLSGLFRFELVLVSSRKDVPLEDVIYKPAKVGMLQRLSGDLSTFRWVSGTVTHFSQRDEGQGWHTYAATLVPDLWKLSQYHRSRIFMDKTTEDLVKDVLAKDLGLGSDDYEWSLARGGGGGDPKERDVYPLREYVVQYEESDLALVSRWLEREGIFYYFDNDGSVEKIRFGDSRAAYRPVNAASPSYPYRPEGATQSSATTTADDGETQAEEVTSFVCDVSRLAQKVELNDYNWRDPSVRLSAQATIYDQGAGCLKEYNDHFKTVGQGDALAQVRAEERSCRGKVFSGQSTCRAFRPGKTFELAEHFRSDFNQEYVLTHVRHSAEQSINMEASTVTGARYHNAFAAIPAEVDFRPERVTPWPAIRGVINAKVDAAGEGDYAELDENGRYKLSIPFDENFVDNTPGEASRWVRMAQPYAGVDSGFHFPLLKGTEVIVTHIDGDPDRPIIASAVPNPETSSPVDSENNRQNQMVTTSGNMFIVDDDEDGAGFVFIDSSGRFVHDFRQASTGGGARRGGGGSGGGRVPPGQPARPEDGARPSPAGPAAAPAPATDGTDPPTASAPAGSMAPTSGEPPEPPAPGEPAGEAAPSAEAPAPGESAEPSPGRSDPRRPGPGQPPRPVPPNMSRAGRKLPPSIQDRLMKAGLGGDGVTADLSAYATFVNSAGDDSSVISTGEGYLNAANGPGGASAPLDEFDTFSGDNFGDARYRIWLGDDIWIRRGNKFLYADVSEDISFGTGGNSYHYENGDTNDESIQVGDAFSKSTYQGMKTSHSFTMAQINTLDIEMSGNAGFKMTSGYTVSCSISSDVKTETEIKIGFWNKNDIALAHSLNTNIVIGSNQTLDIDIGVTSTFKIGIGTDTTITTKPQKAEITIPQKEEVDVNKLQARVNDLEAKVNKTDNAVVDTENVVTDTDNQVVATGNKAVSTDNKGVDTENSGVDTENKGVSTDNTGVSTENAGVSSENKGVSSETSGVGSNTSGVHLNQ